MGVGEVFVGRGNVALVPSKEGDPASGLGAGPQDLRPRHAGRCLDPRLTGPNDDVGQLIVDGVYVLQHHDGSLRWKLANSSLSDWLMWVDSMMLAGVP